MSKNQQTNHFASCALTALVLSTSAGQALASYPQPFAGLGTVTLGQPAETAFYTQAVPAADLASLPHGTLIRYSRIDHTDNASNTDPNKFKTTPTFGGEDNTVPFTMWRVIYTSRGATPTGTVPNAPLSSSVLTAGSPLLTSGVVLVPNTAWTGTGPRPIVVVAPMTQGLGSHCAPSKALQAATEGAPETRRVLATLKKGYAVAIPDYDGYTGGQAHSYLVSQVNGHTTLDIAKALQQIPSTGLSVSAPVAIWGYSEGGTSAAWAGQLQPSYYPTMNLVGVAAGSLVGDISLAAKETNASAYSGLTMMATWGYHVAYGSNLWFKVNSSYWTRVLGSDQPNGPITNPPTVTGNATNTPMLRSDQCVNQMALSNTFLDLQYRNDGDAAAGHPARYTIDEMVAFPDWAAVFEANKVGVIGIPVPTYYYYGVLDLILPQVNFTEAMARLCAKGTKVQKNWYFSGHPDTNGYAVNDVLTFLAARFQGGPVVNSCPP